MFYLIYGTDKAKARAQANKVIAAGKKKYAGVESFRLTAEGFSADRLDELVMSQGLFHSGSVILVDNLCESKENSEIVLKRLKEIKESPNFFVFLEGDLNKKELGKFQKFAEKAEEYKKPEKKLTKKEALALKGEKVDFFDFTNALAARDKKLLWTLYQDALAEDVPSEEIHAMFFWQTKAMLSALKSKDAAEAGLNPFVYSKAKMGARNYGQTAAEAEARLKAMSERLFVMYHDAHRGETDFAVALERFILDI